VIGRSLSASFTDIQWIISPSTLRKAGLSTAKAQTMRNFAAWFTSETKLASALPGLADDQVVETLRAVPGIGPWTVNVCS
jgi:3-methyladenine DNA glycosylase/8-oxoguanine DNA glycosylase